MTTTTEPGSFDTFEKRLYVYIFDESVYDKPWREVRVNREYLKVYEWTEDSLKLNEYTIRFR